MKVKAWAVVKNGSSQFVNRGNIPELHSTKAYAEASRWHDEHVVRVEVEITELKAKVKRGN